MTKLYEQKQFALEWVEQNRQRLSDFHLKIWNYAEPAWREYKSAREYCDLLRAEGFTVEEGSGGMPTAFAGTYGEGEPISGTFAEYDATPGNSQQPVPYRAPRDCFHPWASGHTDTHSMLGVAALTGALAVQKTIQRYGLKGRIKIFGESAEKVCGSKPVHTAKGYYDGFDAFIVYHPSALNTVAWETQFGSYWSAVFTFECLSPEQWIDKSLMPMGTHAHASARCPGAVDAVCLMYTMTKYTKEAVFPATGTWTLNEFILAAGDATADNLAPRFSQIQYAWRSPDLKIQEQIYRVLENNAKHAAAVTGCQASVRWISADARTRRRGRKKALRDREQCIRGGRVPFTGAGRHRLSAKIPRQTTLGRAHPSPRNRQGSSGRGRCPVTVGHTSSDEAQLMPPGKQSPDPLRIQPGTC